MNGETVSSFVEIRGVYLKDYRYAPDCRNSYWPVNGGGPYPDANGDGSPDTICDSVGNIYAVGTSSGRIHIEFDMDWMAAGYCGPSSSVCNNNTIVQYASPGISLDVQGFVYWDPGHAGWWELHPFTAWKLSSEPAPVPGQVSAGFTYAPTNPTPGVSAAFSATASGGSPPYSFSWSFGDGASSLQQNPDHAYAQTGIFQVGLTVTDSAGASDSNSDTIIVVSGTSASWNPNVSCSALVMTIEQIRAISTSNPGVLNSRQLNQPCTVTGRQGMEFSVLVQIDNVKRGILSENDWSTTFASVNGGGSYPDGSESDTSFNVFDPAYFNSCTSATDPNCYQRLYAEIDRDWKAAGYCGLRTICDNSTLRLQTTSSTLIDVQGFLRFNAAYVNATWHSLTAWDLHAITAWRFASDFPPDFEIAASADSVTVAVGQSGTSTISLTSLYGFSGDVTLSAEVAPADSTGSLSPSSPDAELDPANLYIAPYETGTSLLTVSTSLLTLPGTYTVTVTATRGSISHSVTIAVTVVLLGLP